MDNDRTLGEHHVEKDAIIQVALRLLAFEDESLERQAEILADREEDRRNS